MLLLSGILLALGGWALLLAGGPTGLVNLHVVAVAGHVIDLGYLLILAHIIRGLRRKAA